MKKRQNYGLKRTTAIITALLLTGNVMLTSCKKSEKAEDSSETTGETETTEVTEASTEETTETTTEETTEMTTAEATTEETEAANGRDSTPYEEITLDGVKENHYIATDYCFIESEKYVLFLDKDTDLPGDFVVNVDAIIDEIENQLGIEACPSTYSDGAVTDVSVYYDGVNPWKDWNVGNKIQIFLMVDHEDKGWISNAGPDGAVFVIFDLFSEEFYNSVPSYRDNEYLRLGYVNYSEIAHELTHVITERNASMTDILTEGVADYMGRVVIDELAEKYPSIAEYKEKRYLYDYSVPESVNSKNAETIFSGDYHEIDHADRGAEYVYGRYFCQFLSETCGADFYEKLNDAVVAKKYDYGYNNYDEEKATQYTELIKELFGDDVFTKFGKWCTSKGVLQN